MSRTPAMLGVIALVGSTASAQNWPQFRGPNASGIGTGSPPIEWNVETGEGIQWKTAIPGLAHSSPIVWGDRVYLTTAVSANAGEPPLKTGWLQGSGDSAADSGAWSWRVLCLDIRSGKILWLQEAHRGVPKGKRHAKATHANSTPATDGKHIVALFGSEGLYCYKPDGELLWKKDLGRFECGPHDAPGLEWGFASSPILHDGTVIVQCDAMNTAFWAAFDIGTGRELRRVKRSERTTTWCTPAIASAGGRTLVVCNGWRQMAGFDLSTGEEVWRLDGGGDCPVPTPLVAHDLVFLTNGHGRSPIYAIRPDAKGSITPKDEKPRAGVAWWQPKGGSYMPTPIIVGANLYVGDDNGRLRVFDAPTGALSYTERISQGGSTYSASPVSAAGRIYFTSEDGDVHVINAGAEYKHLAVSSMNDVCMATPAISDGRLLVRTRRHLYCIR